MNAGDRVGYVGTLPHGPATVVEVDGDRIVVNLDGIGLVAADVGDVVPEQVLPAGGLPGDVLPPVAPVEAAPAVTDPADSVHMEGI